MISEETVICRSLVEPSYPSPPFSPDRKYPEYPFHHVSREPNHVYDMMRMLLFDLGLDRENFDTPAWNPFRELVKPNSNVVVKPNWVFHENRGNGTLESLTTHPSLVRFLLDYIYIALEGEGRVTVGDAPIQACDLKAVWNAHNWGSIPDFFETNGGMSVDLVDWRLELFHSDNYVTFRKEIRDEEHRFVVVDLGENSALEPVSSDFTNFRVTYYDPAGLRAHHRPGIHQYCVAKSFLESDVVFNVAKLKTHRLTGLTCCMKNMVGINGHKSYLPHHRRGPATAGHDEYPSPNVIKATQTWFAEKHDSTPNLPGQLLLGLPRYLLRYLIKIFRGIQSGAWSGNDTIWRTIVDLNRIALFADKQGVLQPDRQRRMICFADAVIAGEGSGPMRCDDRRSGIIPAGLHPKAVDMAAARIMGFNAEHIPLLSGPESNLLLSNDSPISLYMNGEKIPFANRQPISEPFRPAPGWESLPE